MKVFRYFAHQYPAQGLLVLLCLVVAGAMEGLGLSAVLPILTLLMDSPGSEAESSRLAIWVTDTLDRIGLQASLGTLVPGVIAIFWLKAGVVLIAKSRVGFMVATVATDLRLELLRVLMAARWSYYTRLRPGSAANALATEAERASLAFHHLSQICGYVVETILYLGLALAISWVVTAGALATSVFTFGALAALVRMSGKAGRKQTKFLKSLLSQVTDSLQAVKLLKATGREPLIEPMLEHDTRRLNLALRRRVFSKEALRALQEPITVSCGCAGLFVGFVWLEIPMAEVLLLIALFARTIGVSNNLQRKYQALTIDASALWSMRDMIDQAYAEVEPSLGDTEPTLNQGIELRGITVRLGDATVLEDFDLSMPKGMITALVGESGAGKTTAADLVAGLIRPDQGEVLVDGVPLETLDLQRWRHMIGYVPQEVLMLHDSVEMNVSLGDSSVTPEQVERALRDVGAWGFISELPDGLASSVGERGSLLSGGQRQRIAIARALVYGAELLIMDEATAALDSESEAEIWSTVRQLRGRATVIAISHQPALTGIADRVYRISDGKAVAIESAVARAAS